MKIQRGKRILSGLCGVICCVSIVAIAQPKPTWPQHEWRTATPEAHGVNSEQLLVLLNQVAERQRHVHSIQLVRHGYLVFDANFYPYPRRTLHDAASVTKSVMSLLIGIALDKGYLKSLAQPLPELLPDTRITVEPERKRAITLEHLLKMASGFDCGIRPGEVELFEMMRAKRWPEFALNLPLRAEPGRTFAYCSPNFHLLSAILTKATGKSALAFAQAHLFKPLGITEVYWPADPEGLPHGWGDLHLQPHDLVRISYLMLQQGRWNGRQIISADYIKRATQQQIVSQRTNNYGYGWWISSAAAGAFEANGRGGQAIIVWPEKDLVVVYTGGGVSLAELNALLLPAIKSNQPLPNNPLANQRLQEKLTALTKPPVPKTIPPIPATAASINGKTWRFNHSILGVQTLRVRLLENGAGEVTLTRPQQQFTIPLGFDGVYCLGATGPANLQMGGRAEWQAENELRLELNFIGGINHFTIHLKFEGNKVVARITEATGLPGETLTGYAQP